MSFQPAISGVGLGAWASLKSTMARQMSVFAAQPEVQRDIDRYTSKIDSVTDAKTLVQDRSVLKVALGAFDLAGDLNNRFFIQRILQEGTESDNALANRLRDDRYQALANQFTPAKLQLGIPALAASLSDVTDRYVNVAFETAVGVVDPDLRLALGTRRLLPEIAQNSPTNDVAWFKVMANPPVRAVFEKVFGLPSSFGQIDIDRQLDIFKQKAKQTFGTDSISELSAPDLSEKLVSRFLLRAQLDQSASATGMSVALTLVSQTAAFMKR